MLFTYLESIIGRLQNVSIQAFQSNVIHAIFQTFNSRGENQPTDSLK